MRERPSFLPCSTRPIAASERDATDSYAPDAQSELDLMTLGAMHELGASSAAFSEENHIDESNKNLDWALRRFSWWATHT